MSEQKVHYVEDFTTDPPEPLCGEHDTYTWMATIVTCPSCRKAILKAWAKRDEEEGR